MRYEEFVDRVRQPADFGSFDEVEEAARATFKTLGDYLAGGEGQDLPPSFRRGWQSISTGNLLVVPGSSL